MLGWGLSLLTAGRWAEKRLGARGRAALHPGSQEVSFICITEDDREGPRAGAQTCPGVRQGDHVALMEREGWRKEGWRRGKTSREHLQMEEMVKAAEEAG